MDSGGDSEDDQFRIVNIVNSPTPSSAPSSPAQDEVLDLFAIDKAGLPGDPTGGGKKKKGPPEEPAEGHAAATEAASEGAIAPEAPEAEAEAEAAPEADGADEENAEGADAGPEDADADAEMGTASLIANGCTYTILEQMLMTDVTDENWNVIDKVNVAHELKRCADALHGILAWLSTNNKAPPRQ